MNEWTKATLGAVCRKPQYGAIASGSDEPIGPRFIRQTDVISGRVDWSTVPYCDLAPDEFDKYAVARGDILVSRLGAGVGNAAIVGEPHNAVFAGYLVRFAVDPTQAVAEYVGYLLQSAAWKQHVNSFRSGAAQPTLNAKQMAAFPIRLPSLDEQRRIAGVLGALDDLIETNRSLLPRLEDAARILAARARSETALSAIATAASGKQAKPTGTVEHYSLPAFDAGVVPEIADADTIKSSKLRLCGPTVLVSRLNPRWERCWMAYPGDNAMCSTEFVPLIGQGTEPEEIWAVTSSTAFWEQMRALVTGTTGSHQRVDKEAVLTLMVPDVRQLPGVDRQHIVDLVRGARDARDEIAELTRARDELLALLMSGRVRVREVA